MAANFSSLFKKINSVPFIQAVNDEGRTILFIPAWTVAVAVFLLVLLLRSRRGKA